MCACAESAGPCRALRFAVRRVRPPRPRFSGPWGGGGALPRPCRNRSVRHHSLRESRGRARECRGGAPSATAATANVERAVHAEGVPRRRHHIASHRIATTSRVESSRVETRRDVRSRLPRRARSSRGRNRAGATAPPVASPRPCRAPCRHAPPAPSFSFSLSPMALPGTDALRHTHVKHSTVQCYAVLYPCTDALYCADVQYRQSSDGGQRRLLSLILYMRTVPLYCTVHHIIQRTARPLGLHRKRRNPLFVSTAAPPHRTSPMSAGTPPPLQALHSNVRHHPIAPLPSSPPLRGEKRSSRVT